MSGDAVVGQMSPFTLTFMPELIDQMGIVITVIYSGRHTGVDDTVLVHIPSSPHWSNEPLPSIIWKKI